MSARAIWEATGKDLINRNLNYSNGVAKCRFAVYDQSVSWSQLVQQEPWLETEVSAVYLSIKTIRQKNSLMKNFPSILVK